MINYKRILDFLTEYGGKEYKAPEKLSGDEKKKNEIIKKEGQHVVTELKKIIQKCNKKYNFKKDCKVNWQNSGKIKKYLWIQLKYEKYRNSSPISVSIFVEKDEKGIARYRVSLELRGTNQTDSLDEKKRFNRIKEIYHKHLDISKGEGMDYVLGSNEYGTPKLISESQDYIKEKIMKNNNKVQISVYIENSPEKTNEEYHNEIMNAVEKIKPYYEYVSEKLEKEEETSTMKGTDNKNEIENDNEIIHEKNTILYGPPGTGNTYNTVYYAVAICENKAIDDVKKDLYSDVLKRYNDYKNSGKIEFTTFHQSYGYEEFIEGIKPCSSIEEKNTNGLEYSIVSGAFKAFCDIVKEKKERGNKENSVFIIDEINRGNISKIFGELITLIEDTKREGEKEQISVKLSYSQELFSVPNNVYIIGTMNTADRSISLMDTALRRRFHFVEMMPDTKVLKDISINDKEGKDSGIDVQEMVKKINERIEILYDREHTIGHALFLGLVETPTVEKLASIFKKSIIPLLQEYFYEDYKKIQLILGDNGKKDDSNKFICDKEIKIREIFNGDINDIDVPNIKYSINDEAFYSIDSYLQIYEMVKTNE